MDYIRQRLNGLMQLIVTCRAPIGQFWSMTPGVSTEDSSQSVFLLVNIRDQAETAAGCANKNGGRNVILYQDATTQR